MLIRPLDQVLEAIEKNPDGIFVWVYVDKSYQQSIKISKENAIQWCKDYAKHKTTDKIPCFINHEVFLGGMII